MTKLQFNWETLNPFKRSIATRFKSDSYIVLSLSFFIVILVKKKKKKSQSERRQLHYQKHAVLETCLYVYELWIHLKMLQVCSSSYFSNIVLTVVIVVKPTWYFWLLLADFPEFHFCFHYSFLDIHAEVYLSFMYAHYLYLSSVSDGCI